MMMTNRKNPKRRTMTTIVNRKTISTVRSTPRVKSQMEMIKDQEATSNSLSNLPNLLSLNTLIINNLSHSMPILKKKNNRKYLATNYLTCSLTCTTERPTENLWMSTPR
jgi:hypothetical protein